MNKKRLSIAGLILITFFASIQYEFLGNVPETVSKFSFICITNLIGFVLLALLQLPKLLKISKKTWAKGFLFSLVLTVMNVFMLLGTKGTEPILSASVLSMYFIFITPLLLLLKKRVNFLSGIASVIAVIGLLLIFEVDLELIIRSYNLVYLLAADLLFAVYVLLISFRGKEEDSVQLTLAQMFFSVLLSLAGWYAESLAGRTTMSFPVGWNFWVSAIFIGVFIRAIYGLLQFSCQKNVSPITASLIFSSEVVMTLLMEPVMIRLHGTEYTLPTGFQVVGCIFFVIAALMADDTVAEKLGYVEQDSVQYDENGKKILRTSVAKKMILKTMKYTILTVLASLLVSLGAISVIRNTAVDTSKVLGKKASETSSNALMESLERNLVQISTDKAKLAETKLTQYRDAARYAADYAQTISRNPEGFPEKEVQPPKEENEGKWALQRSLAEESISYEDVRVENCAYGNMESIFRSIVDNVGNVATVYLGTESGLLISYDPYSGDAAPKQKEVYFDYREKAWYKLGKKVERCGFTETYQDSYGRGLTITCVAPFYDSRGEFQGCIGIDILMKELNSAIVSDGIFQPKEAVLFDNMGNVIAGKDIDQRSEKTYNILDDAYNSKLKSVGRTMIRNNSGLIIANRARNPLYVAYSTIESTDWTLAIFCPVSETLKPVTRIQESIDDNTSNVVECVQDSVFFMISNCLVLAALILLIVTMQIGRFSRKITNPLKELEKDVQTITQGDFTKHTEVKTNDEIGRLANSFNQMTDSIHQYMLDLKAATARQERIESELSVAADIQTQMLPSDFEGFSARKEFDLYATMNAAKEVGGDFYDFFMVDDSHLAIVIGDVSGKGVPAALFMVIAKTLIKNRTLLGGMPAEIFTDVNNQLCEGNEACLFVTAWMGIFDLETGRGCCANAGHEYPAIRRGDGDYELQINKHSIALAAMENIQYQDEEILLSPGDSIYVYTDGVPEATNADNQMYGTDRMMAMLNLNKNGSIKDMLHSMKEDIDAFTGDVSAFDDITMLCMKFRGKQDHKNQEREDDNQRV
ncbi:MAG: SpoIIE family protein phosphatase [Blautia sp.]|nr:SpoIIE family protein phosphatase [Blautia sp.]